MTSAALEKTQADAATWARVLRQLQSGVLIMDELDTITHPMKAELNFPIGIKEPLDFGEDGSRWDVPLHLWDAIFSQATQIPPHYLREVCRPLTMLCAAHAGRVLAYVYVYVYV